MTLSSWFAVIEKCSSRSAIDLPLSTQVWAFNSVVRDVSPMWKAERYITCYDGVPCSATGQTDDAVVGGHITVHCNLVKAVQEVTKYTSPQSVI